VHSLDNSMRVCEDMYECNYWVNLSSIESFIVVMIDEKSNQGIIAELEDPKIFVICYKQYGTCCIQLWL
jgi:hypothetical protein